MLNRSASLAMSTSILKALPGKLDIKKHSPSILYLSTCSRSFLQIKYLVVCLLLYVYYFAVVGVVVACFFLVVFSQAMPMDQHMKQCQYFIDGQKIIHRHTTYTEF